MPDRSRALEPLSPRFRALLATAREHIDAHLDLHAGYVAWSGGPNSTAVMLIARQMAPNVPVVWFPDPDHPAGMSEHLAAVAAELNLNFHTIALADPTSADRAARARFGYGVLIGERHDTANTPPGAVCAPLAGWADTDVQAVLTAAAIAPPAP